MTININSGQCALVQICNLSQQYNETVCSGKNQIGYTVSITDEYIDLAVI